MSPIKYRIRTTTIQGEIEIKSIVAYNFISAIVCLLHEHNGKTEEIALIENLYFTVANEEEIWG